jgi:hypothetical protein
VLLGRTIAVSCTGSPSHAARPERQQRAIGRAGARGAGRMGALSDFGAGAARIRAHELRAFAVAGRWTIRAVESAGAARERACSILREALTVVGTGGAGCRARAVALGAIRVRRARRDTVVLAKPVTTVIVGKARAVPQVARASDALSAVVAIVAVDTDFGGGGECSPGHARHRARGVEHDQHVGFVELPFDDDEGIDLGFAWNDDRNAAKRDHECSDGSARAELRHTRGTMWPTRRKKHRVLFGTYPTEMKRRTQVVGASLRLARVADIERGSRWRER